MKTLLLIIILIVIAAAIYLKIKLDKTSKRIKQLQFDRNNLIIEKAKISDQIRLKGIEVDLLKKEKIALTLPEKKMILNALEFSQYKARVQDPKTKRFIWIIYNTLRKKIKESIKE